MTVSSTSNKSPLYVGNATTGPWAFAFKTFAASDLEVVQADADGVETILALTTDYTVSLNSDQNNDPGGEVTTVAAVPNDGSTIIIRWNADATQGLDLQTAGGFYPEAQEDAFDRLTMLVQKVAEETDRALKVSLTAGETVGTEIGGDASSRANRYLGFDSSGNLTLSSSFSAGALTVSAFIETLLDDTTAADARTTLGAASAATSASLAANTFTGIQRWAKGADVASADALTLGTDGNYFDITGTTDITSIGTLGIGTVVKLHFDGILTFTHHATDLILPGAVNITTAAGAEIELVEYATGDWRMVGGVKADGTAWVTASTGITLGTPVASTSGTSIDFTGVPSGVKRITINFAGVSGNGTSNMLVQLGDSGGIENTGYSSGATNDNGTRVTSTAGFVIISATVAGSLFSGRVTLELLDAANFTWVSAGQMCDTGSGMDGESGGNKSLSAELDRVRITTVGGTDTFDAGKINITYES